MTDTQIVQFLAALPDLPISIPLLKELTVLAMKTDRADRADGIVQRRLDRRYQRLCRVQEELGRLDFKKAAAGGPAGFVLEDFVFSGIDFSRYREISERYFTTFFSDGFSDFDDGFFKKNFNVGRQEIKTVIEDSYVKTEKTYRLKKENPLILSVMRSLEMSLEDVPLFGAGEIGKELETIRVNTGGRAAMPDTEQLYRHLVLGLDNVFVFHEDGMTTHLFLSEKGELSGTFRPGDKPWTRVLIPA